MNKVEKRLKKIEELAELMFAEIVGLQEDVEESKLCESRYERQLNDLMEFMTFFSPNASESAIITGKFKELRDERRELKESKEIHLKVRGRLKNLKNSLIQYQKGLAEAEGTKAQRYEFRTKAIHDFYLDYDNVKKREKRKSRTPKQKNIAPIEMMIMKTKKKKTVTVSSPPLVKKVEQVIEVKSEEKLPLPKEGYHLERTFNRHENPFWRLVSSENGKIVIENRKMAKVMDVLIKMNISVVSCDEVTAEVLGKSFATITEASDIPEEKLKSLIALKNKLSYEPVIQ